MAESQAEKRLREVETNLAVIDATLKLLRREVEKEASDGKDTAKLVAEAQKELAEVKREMAGFRVELAELKKRFETKETWFRGLVASALVALLTSVVALIVALVRK